MFRKCIVRGSIFAIGLVAGALNAPTASARSPVIEVFDHMLGFNYVTFSEDWAFSPVSKHGVFVMNSALKGTARLKKSIFNQSIEKAVAKRKKSVLKGKNSKITSEADSAQIAGTFAASGFTWVETKRKQTTLQLWFIRDEILHEAQCDGQSESFAAFLPECLQFLDKIKPLD
jgi:hypothetical protein